MSICTATSPLCRRLARQTPRTDGALYRRNSQRFLIHRLVRHQLAGRRLLGRLYPSLGPQSARGKQPRRPCDGLLRQQNPRPVLRPRLHWGRLPRGKVHRRAASESHHFRRRGRTTPRSFHVGHDVPLHQPEGRRPSLPDFTRVRIMDGIWRSETGNTEIKWGHDVSTVWKRDRFSCGELQAGESAE